MADYRPMTLPAWDGSPATVREVQFDRIRSRGDRERWVLLELASLAARPWNVKLQWGAGGGRSPQMQITLASASRICLYGAEIGVYGINLAPVDNPVTVNVTELPAPIATHNVRAYTTPSATADFLIPIPVFATAVLLDVAAPATGTNKIELVDAQGVVVGTYAHADIPAGGVPVAGIDAVRATTGSAARITFPLAL